jgi:hypothetical protein
MNKKLLVILITFNSKKFIERCLDSIARQAFNDYTLLIIDNNSTDGAIKTIKNYFLSHHGLGNKTELLKNNQNIGFARAVNIGLKKALSRKGYYEYEAVLLINPDTYFDKYLFKNGIDTLFLEKDVGACSPTILYPDERIWWIGTNLLTPREIVLDMHQQGISKHIDQGKKKLFKKGLFESELLTGCALFIKTEAIRKVGLFDENYFMYVEDIDYSLRLKKYGYKLCMFTNSKIYHIKDKNIKFSFLEIRREILTIISVGKYIFKEYPLYIFIAWLIKLPIVLGFKCIKSIINLYGKKSV